MTASELLALARHAGLCLFIACAAQCPAVAQVQVDAQGGFEGQYREGSYLGVTVDLTNGGKSTRGELSASFGSGPAAKVRYTQRVDLPAGARKRTTLYVRPSSFENEVQVRFTPERGRPVVARAQLAYSDASSVVAYAIHDQGSGYHFIRSIDTSKWAAPAGGAVLPGTGATGASPATAISVAYADTTHMPDSWKGYDSADLVILDEHSPSALTADQAQALKEWVAMGGHVLVVGGEDWQRLEQGPFADMLPVDVRGEQPIAAGLPELAATYGGSMPPGAPVITLCQARKGAETLLSHEGRPLIVRGTHGIGSVYFLAFAVDRQPIKDWSGLQSLVSQILQEIRSRSPRLAAGISEPQVCDGLCENPSMAVPSFRVVGVFLLAYLICLVPANYFVLKRLGKRELAWLTTPAIVVVFTLVAYVMGLAMRGGDVVVYSASVVEARDGSPLGVTSGYFGIFSPRKTRYGIAFSQPHVAIGVPSRVTSGFGGIEEVEAPAMTLASDGGEDTVRSVLINMWDQQLLKARAATALDGAVTADLRVVGGELVGEVHNGTSMTMAQTAIRYRSLTKGLGDIAPSASAPVRTTAAAPAAMPAPAVPHGSGPMGPMPYMGPSSGTPEGRDAFNQLMPIMGPSPASAADDPDSAIRRGLLAGLLERGQPVFADDEALVFAWLDGQPLRIDLGGSRHRSIGRTLLVVHVPVSE